MNKGETRQIPAPFQSLIRSFTKSRSNKQSVEEFLAEGQQELPVKLAVFPPREVSTGVKCVNATKEPQLASEGQRGLDRIFGEKCQSLHLSTPDGPRKSIADILHHSSRNRHRSFKSNDQRLPVTPTATGGTQKLIQEIRQNDSAETEVSPSKLLKLRKISFDFSASANQTKIKSPPTYSRTARSKMLYGYLLLGSSTSAQFMYKSRPSVTHVQEIKDGRTKINYDLMTTHEFIQAETDAGKLIPVATKACQTPQIEVANKWTQHPPKLSSPRKGTEVDGHQLHLEAQGVSSDPPLPESVLPTVLPDIVKPKKDSENQLIKFTKNAGDLMINALGRRSAHSYYASSQEQNGRDKSGLEFGRYLPQLKEMRVLHCNRNLLACVSEPKKRPKGTRAGEHGGLDVITVWTTHQPLKPKYFLRVFGEVTKIQTEIQADLLVAGTAYGCLNIFDLREDEIHHRMVIQLCKQVMRIPSYHTGLLEEGVENHRSRIVGIETLKETAVTTQIVSLEKENVVISWTCTRLPGVGQSDLSGNATAWSTLQVRIRHVLKLSEMFKVEPLVSCNCLVAWEGDFKEFLVGSDNGFIAKGRIAPSSFPAGCQNVYRDANQALRTRILHLDLNKEFNIFLAMSDDNKVRVFDLPRSCPILSFAYSKIPVKVQWSQRRMSVFYVAFRDSVEIWDLVASDLEPMRKLRTNELVDFDLVQVGDDENMAMLTHKGTKLYLVAPPCKILQLDSRHERLLRHYISIVD